MTLAMALDNSFEIMNEDEMYDVNGGAKWKTANTFAKIAFHIGVMLAFTASAVVGIIKSIAAMFASAVTVVGVYAAFAAMTGSVALASGNGNAAVMATYYAVRDGGFQYKTNSFIFWSVYSVKPL